MKTKITLFLVTLLILPMFAVLLSNAKALTGTYLVLNINPSPTAHQGDTVQLMGRLYTSSGSPILGKTLKFYVNGALVGSGSDSTTGWVGVYYTVNLGPGSYTVQVTFDGDSTYSSSYTTATLTVVLTGTYIVVSIDPSATVHQGDAITLFGKLFTSSGVVILGKTLKFYVNGVYVNSATTGGGGGWAQVPYIVNLGLGSYEVKVTFDGDLTYSSSYGTTTLAVSARASSILQNGGFEQGFAYWVVEYQPPYSNGYNLDNSVYHSGQYSAHASGYNCFMHQVLTVVDGTIDLSFWAKGTGPTLIPEIIISTTWGGYITPWDCNPTSEWACYTYDFNITHFKEEHGISAGTVMVNFVFQGPGAEVWIDDVEVNVHLENQPPSAPSTPQWAIPEEILRTNQHGVFKSSATDPDNDQVQIVFDWGDGSTDTSGLNPSGTTIQMDHSWSGTGMFEVRAKAVDEYKLESGWSSPLEVTVLAPPTNEIPAQSNWAGYIIKSSTDEITSVEGTWSVPQFSAPFLSFQATWIGVGGIASSPLLQAGIMVTGIDPDGNQPIYQAFWMSVPRSDIWPIHVDLNPLDTINVGDKITANITEVGSGSWRVWVEDNTKGWSVFGGDSIVFSPDKTAAEWVHEPNAKASGMASFDPIVFSVTQLTINGISYKMGKIDSSLNTELYMTNYASDTQVSPISKYEQFTISYIGTLPMPTASGTMLSLHSNADLHVYDYVGNHDGYNATSGLIDMQIPNSMYFEDEEGVQHIILFAPSVYRIELVGKESGEFHLNVQASYQGVVILDQWINGTTSVGAMETHHLYVPPKGTPMIDDTPPSITVVNPPIGWALQDGITFMVNATDLGSGVSSVNLSIRDGHGNSLGFDNMAMTYNSTMTSWTLHFNTLLLPDGYCKVIVNVTDDAGNMNSTTVPYSIRNWAVLQLLRASVNNQAGRTMPVKFALRISKAVDPTQSFVYNEELTIKIYATSNPSSILQTSAFGTSARNYRIDTVSQLYITNFQTLKTPMQYTASIFRNAFPIGSFYFQTTK